jgi:hypothetical protein
MSRFHFHLTSSHDVPDIEGVELASLEDARCYAVKMMAEVLCTSPERYWEAEIYRVTATDESGLTLFTVEIVSTDAAAVSGRRS